MSSPISKPVFWVLLVLALAAGIWARLFYAPFDAENTLNRTPDEPMYTAYASVAAQQGFISGTKISAKEYNQNPKIQIYPPPTRIGYLYLLAAAMKKSGRMDISQGIEVSKIISVLSLILLALVAVRFFGPGAAFFACMAMSFSPMELAFSRKVWQDGLMTLVGGVLLLLAFEIVRSKRKTVFILLFMLAGFYGLLVKESCALVFGLLGLFTFALLLKKRDYRMAVLLMITMVCAAAGSLAVLAKVSGGFPALKEVYTHFKQSFPTNSYVVEYQSGPWTSFFKGLFLLTPLTCIFCALGIFEVSSWGLAALFLSFIAALSLPPYLKNIRFLSPVFIPFYLLAGNGIYSAMSKLCLKTKGWMSWAVFFFAVTLSVAAASLDAAHFHKLFIENHVKDLIISSL